MGRRKRIIRDEGNPPGMRLEERDLEILRQVQAYRLLTTEQVCRLLFTPSTKSSCVKRLRFLFHNGYLDRAPVIPGLATGKLIHRLTKKGVMALGGKPSRKRARLSYFTIQHMIENNDARVAIQLSARACGFTIEEWRDDLTLRRAEMKDYVRVREKGATKKVALVPDAYFILVTPRRAHFLLELDRGTEDNERRWRGKIRAYEAYTRAVGGKPSLYEQRYKVKSLRVLTVTTSESRLANMLKVTEAESSQSFYWFTTQDALKTENALTAAIWRQANTDHRRKALIS